MHWKLTFLIGTPIGIILTIAFTVAAIKVWKWTTREIENDRYLSGAEDKFFHRAPALALIAGAVLSGGITTAANFPYQAEYLQWRPVAGVVEQVDSRFNSRESGVSETYVLTIDGQPYRVDDNRAITVEKGDDVALMCTREWQWAASPGYACRWNQ